MSHCGIQKCFHTTIILVWFGVFEVVNVNINVVNVYVLKDLSFILQVTKLDTEIDRFFLPVSPYEN